MGEGFLELLAAGLPDDERLILCGFKGDPNSIGPKAWRPRPWRPGKEVPFERGDNGYVTVASFGRAEDRTFRRRTATFAAGRALMVDDLGTKVPMSIIEPLKPSALIETSEGNFQAWYFLATPERNRERFDGTIRAFIQRQLLGADPGMAGVTRVGRLPGYTNGKPHHKGFLTRLRSLDAYRYEISEILSAFNLTIQGKRLDPPMVRRDDRKNRIEAFGNAELFLKDKGLLKRDFPDLGGWIEMTCPWLDEHTAGADTGAAIREPAEENQWYGSFKCHHGHCAERGWRQLTDYISEFVVEELDAVNAAAPSSLKELLVKRRRKA